VQLINHKSYHDKAEYNAKYTNLSYSSIFTYDSRAVYGSFNCDSSLQWSEDGIHYRQRWSMENLYCERDFAASRYPLYETDPEGEAVTWTIVKDGLLIHVHKVRTTPPSLLFRQGGYPLGFDEGSPELTSYDREAAEIARFGDRYSMLAGLGGFTRRVPARPFHDQVNGVNTRHVQSITPRLEYDAVEPGAFLLASAVYANRGSDTDEQLLALLPEVEQRGELIHLRFADGTECLLNTGELRELDRSVGGVAVSGRPRFLRVENGTVILQVE
jgi:hypothetical protein